MAKQEKVLRRYEHLVTDVPNNRLTRWLVNYANRRMTKCESKYHLVIKYRKPKKGEEYGWGGALKRQNARKFAIYCKPHINAKIHPMQGYGAEVDHMREKVDAMYNHMLEFWNLFGGYIRKYRPAEKEEYRNAETDDVC